jgi:hypothetical protein
MWHHSCRHSRRTSRSCASPLPGVIPVGAEDHVALGAAVIDWGPSADVCEKSTRAHKLTPAMATGVRERYRPLRILLHLSRPATRSLVNAGPYK